MISGIKPDVADLKSHFQRINRLWNITLWTGVPLEFINIPKKNSFLLSISDKISHILNIPLHADPHEPGINPCIRRTIMFCAFFQPIHFFSTPHSLHSSQPYNMEGNGIAFHNLRETSGLSPSSLPPGSRFHNNCTIRTPNFCNTIIHNM